MHKRQVRSIQKKNNVCQGRRKSGFGFRQTGCSLGINLEIPKVRELYHIGADIGNHLVVVYGDYTREMRDLARILNYEVLEARNDQTKS